MKNEICRVRLAVISLTGLLAVASALVYTTFSSSPGYIAEFAANSAGNTQINSTAGTTPWDLQQIKAPEAWQIAPGGGGVLVAVLDTGIDSNHKDLAGKVVGRVNYSDSPSIDVVHGHGTMVAGLIAGMEDQSGTSGVAFNASLLDVQIADNDGITDAAKVAKGIIWAVNNGAQVINISVVIYKPYPMLALAVDYAWNKGCIIVAAAGNNFTTAVTYPASYPHVISVAATDSTDSLAKWSTHGDWVSVAAPGENVSSIAPGNDYATKSGSSFSAALVSGEAALLYSTAVDVNADGQINDEVFNSIVNASDDIQVIDGPARRINVYDAAFNTALLSATFAGNEQ